MKNRYTHSSIKGFTLIELLVVIAIIGILAAATLAAINPFGQFSKARDAQRKSDLKQIQTALELYNQDTGAYPLNNAAIPWGNTWGTYMSKVPQDKSGSIYYYVSVGGGYRIYANLERDTDPQRCGAPGITCTGLGVNCGSNGACDYDVSSSNLPR